MTDQTLALTVQLVEAYVRTNQVAPALLPAVINTMHAAVLKSASPAAPDRPEPAVPIGKSVTHDHIVCLEDGKQLKSMKRYLRRFNLTPQQYRKRWDLPPDYPMVAPAYAALRSQFAKDMGLGRTRGTAA
jgi:predicted transcriptional regulator